jgi:hypothetical protein
VSELSSSSRLDGFGGGGSDSADRICLGLVMLGGLSDDESDSADRICLGSGTINSE